MEACIFPAARAVICGNGWFQRRGRLPVDPRRDTHISHARRIGVSRARSRLLAPRPGSRPASGGNPEQTTAPLFDLDSSRLEAYRDLYLWPIEIKDENMGADCQLNLIAATGAGGRADESVPEFLAVAG